MDQQSALIQSLIDHAVFGVSAKDIERIETHISTVLLTGEYAYKFKKPVNFGFLDFSTLAARKHFCEEEIRLNQRLAPTLYLDTVAITGSTDAPAVNGDGEAIEYAVRMRQFDQSGLLDNLIKQGEVTAAIVDAIADKAASFHAIADKAPADNPFGQPKALLAPMEQNFEQLRGLVDKDKFPQLARLEEWTLSTYSNLKPLLEQRVAAGFIRECHGDMHLGNITLLDGEVTIFDGIEFNEEFRWIDVMSEMAFITMDLIDRKQPGMAQQLINRYLEKTGDYAGVPLLRFYQVYRALVRAKIASFRLADPALSASDRAETLAQYQSYSDLAESLTEVAKPRLILSHGVSGSGKSTLGARLLEQLPAIRIRSDVERKRLFAGKTPGVGNGVGEGMYSSNASKKSYARLLQLTEALLRADVTVLVDATFLKKAHREPFQRLAAQLGVPSNIVSSDCDPATLRTRVTQRTGDVSDATVAVLEHQLEEVEPPSTDENPVITPCSDIDVNTVLDRLNNA